MENITTYLIELALTAVVVILTRYLIPMLKNSAGVFAEKAKNDRAKATIEAVSNLIFDVTAETTQTFVDELKKGGLWNEQSKVQAFQKSREKALLMISKEAREIIAEIYGDFDAWLTTQIESSVHSLKE